MKRSNWLYRYDTPTLFAAAQAKRMYHEERVAWWTDEEAKANTALRERGVEFREVQQTGGGRTDAVLDPQLSNRLAECRSKKASHQQRAEEYSRWERTFAKSSEPHHELDADDIAFFGVADGAVVSA